MFAELGVEGCLLNLTFDTENRGSSALRNADKLLTTHRHFMEDIHLCENLMSKNWCL
jgi:hypothetical protein